MSHLRRKRLSLGRTLVEMAAKAGTTHASLSRIERGIILPRRKLARRLASIYGMDLRDIYGEIE